MSEKRKNTGMVMFVSLSACFNSRAAGLISMNFHTNRMPLEATPNSVFVISCRVADTRTSEVQVMLGLPNYGK
jgi:hypothetical protein